MAVRFGGAPGGVPSVTLPLNQMGANQFYLDLGEVITVPPGTWNLYTDGIAALQVFDPVMQIWIPQGPAPGPAGLGTDLWQIDSDGSNYRLANTTSCPIGAILTNAGSGYTSVPTVTPSEGASTWIAFVGGAISNTVTVTSGGSGYVYPPLCVIAQPPGQGIPALARTTISAGAVTTITVAQQGANYPTAPLITLVNDPRDTTGSGATAVCTLTGAQTVTGVLCTEPFGGTAISSGTVPTLTFSGGGGSSAAATAVMDWIIGSYSVANGGAGYVAPIEVHNIGTGIPGSANAYRTLLYSFWRTAQVRINGAVSGGAITATGSFLESPGRVGGIISNIGVIVLAGAGPTTVASLTLNVGGTSSFVYMQNAGG